MKQMTLSIEQMKLLVEMGVDTSDASMCYYYYTWDGNGQPYSYGLCFKESFCPAMFLRYKDYPPVNAYTLQDLLGKFDAYILYHFKNGTVALEGRLGDLRHEIKSKSDELSVAYEVFTYLWKKQQELIAAAEIAWEEIYHVLKEDSGEEEAAEIATKRYIEICGQKPDLRGVFGLDWLTDEEVEDILNGTYIDKHR